MLLHQILKWPSKSWKPGKRLLKIRSISCLCITQYILAVLVIKFLANFNKILILKTWYNQRSLEWFGLNWTVFFQEKTPLFTGFWCCHNYLWSCWLKILWTNACKFTQLVESHSQGIRWSQPHMHSEFVVWWGASDFYGYKFTTYNRG